VREIGPLATRLAAAKALVAVMSGTESGREGVDHGVHLEGEKTVSAKTVMAALATVRVPLARSGAPIGVAREPVTVSDAGSEMYIQRSSGLSPRWRGQLPPVIACQETRGARPRRELRNGMLFSPRLVDRRTCRSVTQSRRESCRPGPWRDGAYHLPSARVPRDVPEAGHPGTSSPRI